MSDRAGLALTIALLLGPSLAHAQATETPEAEASDVAATDDAEGPPEDHPIERRTLPDYDGRPDPGMDAGDVLLWVPRIVFWPVHAVLEYIVRRPLGWILTTGERERWDAFQLQPLTEQDPSWGVVPTLFFDFGFAPSGGLYLWFDDVIARGNGLRFQIGFGGIDWLRGMVIDRVTLSDTASVEARFEAIDRPDYLFVGIGGIARPEIQSRYARRTLEGAVRADFRPWRASYFRIEAGVLANEFEDTDFRWSDSEDTISSAIERGFYPNLSTLPPGFEGYTAYSQRIEGAIDTRETRPSDGSGVRVQAHAELGLDVHRPLDRRWVLWGGGVGAYWDVSEARTLSLWGIAEFATPLGADAVPFTELPDIGGRGRMTAFRRGWLIGESVAAAVLEYRYPIWVAMDGFVNVATGNAFGPNLAGFDAQRLRLSFALGLRTVGDPDQSFTLQVGMGTATFEEGLEPAIVRITAGMQEGF